MSLENNTDKNLGSANRVPWELCAMLRRLAFDTQPDQERSLIEQNGVAAIFLGLNAIESFVNIFFRVVAEESQFVHARERILKDLDNRQYPLHKKLRIWPKYAFNKTIEEDDERWKRFILLKNWRNTLMHFKSTHETVVLSNNVIFTGLVDLSAFAKIDADTPRTTLSCVRGIVEAIGECRSGKTDKLSGFTHQWIGIES